MIGIIDYGAGNLMSVSNALKSLGLPHQISRERETLAACDKLILPGVGAFPYAMKSLREAGLVDFIRDECGRGKPLLGICLGMQMLFDDSDELEPTAGLGLIPGRVTLIRTEEKLPCIGWNALRYHHPCPLLDGVPEGTYVYFVHSYCGHPAREEDLIATADYGEPVTALTGHGVVFGAQFHPEKSGDLGLRMLKNFGELRAE